jgi:hypothetical protein
MLLDCVDLGIWVIHLKRDQRPLVWNLTYYLHPSTMNMSARRPSEATSDVQHFIGYVETTTDALRLIMAARQGIIPRITRRLNDSERRSMIRSGAVFVFCVEESGIKRWTEGLSWSPSRIVGNFLVCHCIALQSWLRLTRTMSLRCTARSASGIPIGARTRHLYPPERRLSASHHRALPLTHIIKGDQMPAESETPAGPRGRAA